jgi:hypothetical protein
MIPPCGFRNPRDGSQRATEFVINLARRNRRAKTARRTSASFPWLRPANNELVQECYTFNRYLKRGQRYLRGVLFESPLISIHEFEVFSTQSG